MSGLELRKQPAEIGEVLSDDFDGTVLNPRGVEIDLPFWVFKQLKKLHLLERDHKTGKRQICERVFELMDLWDGPDFRPDRELRTFDPGYQRARPKDSGYASSFLKALGRDCSGLAAPAIERTRDFESDLSFWPLHPFYEDMISWSLFEKTVPDKVLLGSDYPPGQTPAEAVEAVHSLPISEDFMRKILGENAARLLSL